LQENFREVGSYKPARGIAGLIKLLFTTKSFPRGKLGAKLDGGKTPTYPDESGRTPSPKGGV